MRYLDQLEVESLAANQRIAGKLVTVGTVAGSYTTDTTRGNLFDLTLTGALTLANPTGLPAAYGGDQRILWRLRQDGVGGHVLTLGGKFRVMPPIGSVVLSTSADAVDYLMVIYNAADDTFDVVSFLTTDGSGGGSGITGLTADVTASGSGSVAATVVAIQGRDVSTTTPTDNYVLTWVASTSKWTPVAATGGGVTGSGVAGEIACWSGTSAVTGSGTFISDGNHIAVGNPASLDNGNILYSGFQVYSPVNIQYSLTGNTTQPYGEYASILSYTVVNESFDGQAYYGTDISVSTDPASTNSPFFLGGINGQAFHQGSGAVNRLEGLIFAAYNAGAGTADSLNGIAVYAGNYGSGSVRLSSAIYIYNPSSSGPVAENYGIYIGNQIGQGASTWSIYSVGGDVYFGNCNFTVVGSDATKSPLTVQAIVSQTAPLTRLRAISSTSTPRDVAYLDAGFTDPTDLSYKGYARLCAQDAAATAGGREGVRVGTDGTQALVGLFGAAPVPKATITGSKGGNAALANLLTYLASRGDIIDSTT